MKKISLTAVLIAALLLSSCTKNNSEPINKETTPAAQVSTEISKIEKPAFTKADYPKIDGSTATIPLSEALASNLLGMSKDEATAFVKHSKTHGAYENLISGNADIIFVTEPSEEELKMIKSAKLEVEIIPVVKEGFVFLVNTNNPVNNLSTKQVQDIYQGKITNWKQVGGENKKILAYQRDINSGSQTLMLQTVMKDLKIAEAPKEAMISGMSGLIESIAKYNNSKEAIGYSVYYYANTMYTKDTIKLLSIDGVKPDNASISSEKYPFTSAYYAVLKKSSALASPQRKLLNWLLSEDGQKLAEASGYVPVKMR